MVIKIICWLGVFWVVSILWVSNSVCWILVKWGWICVLLMCLLFMLYVSWINGLWIVIGLGSSLIILFCVCSFVNEYILMNWRKLFGYLCVIRLLSFRVIFFILIYWELYCIELFMFMIMMVVYFGIFCVWCILMLFGWSVMCVWFGFWIRELMKFCGRLIWVNELLNLYGFVCCIFMVLLFIMGFWCCLFFDLFRLLKIVFNSFFWKSLKVWGVSLIFLFFFFRFCCFVILCMYLLMSCFILWSLLRLFGLMNFVSVFILINVICVDLCVFFSCLRSLLICFSFFLMISVFLIVSGVCLVNLYLEVNLLIWYFLFRCFSICIMWWVNGELLFWFVY